MSPLQREAAKIRVRNHRTRVGVGRSVVVGRSLVKAITHRIVVSGVDFLVVYLFTGQLHVALGFALVSGLYTPLLALAHDRIWARIG